MDYRNAFREYLEGRKSSLTVKNYSHTLEHYLRFLKTQEPDEFNVEQFLAYMSHKGCGARSLNRHLAALKSFFKYILRKELILEGYRYDKKLPIWLDEDEQKKYRAACTTPLEKALAAVFLGAGLRVQEVADLEIDNVNPDGYLKVMGKGKIEAVIAVQSQVIDAINEYLAYRTDHSNKVFPRGARTIEKIIKEIAKRAKIDKRVTPHTLRHSMGSLWIDKGGDLTQLKETLRHKNINTTMVYVHIKPEKIKKKMPKLLD